MSRALSGGSKKALDRILRKVATLMTTRDLPTIVNNSKASVALLDKEGRYVACSARYVSDFKLERHMPIYGKTIPDLFPQASISSGSFADVTSKGITPSREEPYKFTHLDGEEQWIVYRTINWLDSLGNRIGFMVVCSVASEKDDLIHLDDVIEENNLLSSGRSKHASDMVSISRAVEPLVAEVVDLHESLLDEGGKVADFTIPMNIKGEMKSVRITVELL